jgi:hypothetical protein
MRIGESREWVWATPDPTTGRCPAGFGENSWGCFKRKATFGESISISEHKAVWLGIFGLALSAGIMIAMGFHKPVERHRRTRR